MVTSVSSSCNKPPHHHPRASLSRYKDPATVRNQHIKSSQRSQTVATGTPPTPRKPGGSGNLEGHRTMTEARNMLRDELDGSVVELSDSNLKAHLDSIAVSDNLINNFLQTSGLYDSGSQQWNDLPRSLPKESDMYKPLHNIFSSILAHEPFLPESEALDQPLRMAHYSYSAGVVEMQQDNGDKLRAYPDLYISGVGVHFKSKEHFTQDKLPSPDFDPNNEDLLLDDEDFEEDDDDVECLDVGDDTSELDDDISEVNVESPEPSDAGDDTALPDTVNEAETNHSLKERKEVREKRKLYWSGCASFVEAKLNTVKSNYEAKSKTGNFAFWQVASYARNCFIAQPTRIFVYSLLITETHFRLCRFDRCGAMRTTWIDYHNNPAVFVRVILLISSTNPKLLGLDLTTKFNDEGKLLFTIHDIEKGEEMRVTEVRLEFQALSVRGRATVCWYVLDEKGTPRLLKQQFVNTCRVEEGKILKDLEDIDGVAKLISHQKYEKVSESRKTDTDHDRQLYRALLEACGNTIDRVRSKLAFLKALRSAIQAHRDVYLRKNGDGENIGYIHRDISINNILYPFDDDTNSSDECNPSGFLIDYDMAVSLMRALSNAGADFRTGTHAFQSILVLETQNPKAIKKRKPSDPVIIHDHLDDLESFIWVFAWVISSPVRENRPARPYTKRVASSMLHVNFQGSYEHARNCKYALLGKRSFEFGHGWKGSAAIKTLTAALFQIANNNLEWKQVKMAAKRGITVEELLARAPNDYNEMLNAFTDAIEQMEIEMGIHPKPKARQRGNGAVPKATPANGTSRGLRTTLSKRSIASAVAESDEKTRPAKRPRTVSQPKASESNSKPVASGSGSRRVTRSASKGSVKSVKGKKK